ncbi:helix-turn-helix transcriptional regulator [Devosia sp.]|uniref:helix-turn-helix domain-containing protein n=1 Tax=Devosia sp. TaxID=1871048 RepID=UPI002AFEC8EA|nr:helix-turn-helix transcriptional regulator [Devosia sp.]
MEKLKSWRIAEGLSLEGAGALLGISGVQWHRYEVGSRAIPHDRVLRMERITGISRHELRPDLSRIFVEGAPSKEGEVA